MRALCASSCSGSLPSGPLPEKSHTTMLLAPLDEVASQRLFALHAVWSTLPA